MGTITTLKPRRSGVGYEPPPSATYRRETAQEIALRIRSGMGPTRPIVVRCLTRTENERWI